MLSDKKLHTVESKIDFFIGVPILFAVGFLRDLFDFFWRPFQRFIWNFKKNRRSPRPRILIIKHSNVDESALMLPALYMLKKQFKEANITFLGGAAVGTFLIKTKLVDRAEVFSIGTVLQMMKASFMLVIDFETTMRTTAIATALMKTPLALGFETRNESRHHGYDECEEFNPKLNLAENYWNLATAACEHCGHTPAGGFEADKNEVREKMMVDLPSRSKSFLQMSLPKNICVLNPCAENISWPVSQWINLMDNLKEKNSHVAFLIIGTDEFENKKIINVLKEKGAISWVDKLSFDEIFQIFSSAERIISLGTYMIQIASLLNDHVVSLSGQELLWGGVTVKTHSTCAPCLTWGYDYGCLEPACMNSTENQKVC